MAVVYGVIFVFIAAFFAIPAMFPSMAPNRKQALSWTVFRMRGIQTATGHASATEATILVLLLPFLVFCFGMAVAAIAMIVADATTTTRVRGRQCHGEDVGTLARLGKDHCRVNGRRED